MAILYNKQLHESYGIKINTRYKILGPFFEEPRSNKIDFYLS